MDAVLLGLVTSLAVTIIGPGVTQSYVDSSVTLKVFVPATRAASGGRTACGSLEVSVKVSVTVGTLFPNASTALTVAANAVPAVCGVAVGGHAE